MVQGSGFGVWGLGSGSSTLSVACFTAAAITPHPFLARFSVDVQQLESLWAKPTSRKHGSVAVANA